MFLFFSRSLVVKAQVLKKKEDIKKLEGFFGFYYSEKMTFSTTNSWWFSNWKFFWRM